MLIIPLLLEAVRRYLYQAITAYFDTNTIAGCTNISSSSFDSFANTDDGTMLPKRLPGRGYHGAEARWSLQGLG